MSEQTPDELKTALRNALKATPKLPHFFALIPKGGAAGALMVDKRRIPSARSDAVKKALGASSVVRGTCFGEDGALVFQTVKPAGATAAPLAKKLAQVHAGISIKPEFRLAPPGTADDGDDEQGEVDTEDSPVAKAAAPTTSSADRQAYDEVLSKIEQPLLAARDAHSAAAPKAAALLQLAAGKAKTGDHRAALQGAVSARALLEADVRERADAMQQWKAQRAVAITSLKSMASKIAAAKHPSSGKAIVEIQSVVKNLTAEPASGQQVVELERWLTTDQVVADVCELVEDIRTPLGSALEGLRVRFA